MAIQPSSIPHIEKHLRLVRAALEFQHSGDHDIAQLLLEKALEISPTDTSARVLLGLSHQAQADLEGAEKIYGEVLMLDRNHLPALKSLGLLLVGQKRYEQGILYLRRYLAEDSGDLVALDGLIGAYLATGQAENVENTLREVWEKSPQTEIGIRYGRYQLSKGQNEEALTIFESASQTEKSAKLLSEQALALVLLDRNEEAILRLQEAIRLEPTFDRAWRGLATCFTRLGNFKEALVSAEQALAYNRGHYRNWHAYGDALFAADRVEEALTAYKQGIDLIDLKNDPDAEPVLAALYLQRFNALMNLGRISQALAEMEIARKHIPMEERFTLYPAQVLIEAGDSAEAMKLLDEAQAHGLPWEKLLQTRVKAHLHSEDVDGALTDLHPVFEPSPEQAAAILSSEAFDLYMNGNCGPARKVFQTLAGLFPDVQLYPTNYAFILIGDGDLDRAETILEAVLQKIGTDHETLSLAACNLGYAYLLMGRTPDAIQCFQKVLETSRPDHEAILRIAYFQGAQVRPGCNPYPTQSLPVQLAAKANLVTLYLQEGQIKKAQQLAEEIHSRWPEASLTHELIGAVYAAAGNKAAALSAWQEALQFTQEPTEVEMVHGWLEQG